MAERAGSEDRVAAFTVRTAQPADVPALVGIEERCFATDRLSRRRFQHMIGRAHATLLVGLHGTIRAGYALLLFHAGTSLARLYSLAVDPVFQGSGLGAILLGAAERVALEQDCLHVRLEVRRDNDAAIALYRRNGFQDLDVRPDYYHDHMEALRLEKRLAVSATDRRTATRPVPFYRQTLDFTCGPSALMMGLKALRPGIVLDRALELRIWREATTVFMTSGLGGCGPHGLALAAWKRGLAVDLYVRDDGVPFLDGVRSQEKKDVISLVHRDMVDELARTGVRVHRRILGPDEMTKAVSLGAVPIVLISSYRIYHEKFPHWVVVADADDRFLYVHDPLVDERHSAGIDRMFLPIPRRDFDRMARYGKAQLRASLILWHPSSPGRGGICQFRHDLPPSGRKPVGR